MLPLSLLFTMTVTSARTQGLGAGGTVDCKVFVLMFAQLLINEPRASQPLRLQLA